MRGNHKKFSYDSLAFSVFRNKSFERRNALKVLPERYALIAVRLGRLLSSSVGLVLFFEKKNINKHRTTT